MNINPAFEQWWDENCAQYAADACHMSEFHMASVVWQAATLAERERCALVAQDFDGSWGHEGAAVVADAIREDPR